MSCLLTEKTSQNCRVPASLLIFHVQGSVVAVLRWEQTQLPMSAQQMHMTKGDLCIRFPAHKGLATACIWAEAIRPGLARTFCCAPSAEYDKLTCGKEAGHLGYVWLPVTQRTLL